MKRFFLLATFAFLAALPAKAANDVYLANAAAGGNTGVDCADAKAYTYANSGGNYSATPTGIQIGPDTTVHICGTISPSAGTNAITFQGSGSAGHPITLVFETSAVLTNTYWPGDPSGSCTSNCGAIDTNGFSFITINGTNGLITATANGSSLTNHVASMGIFLRGDHLLLKNMTVTHIYDNTSAETSAQNGNGTADVRIGAMQNVEVCNNTLSNAHVGIWSSASIPTFTAAPSNSCADTQAAAGVNLYANTLTDHGWQMNIGGNGFSNIFQNDISDFANWFFPTGPPGYHLDGIIVYGGVGGAIAKPYIYNNYIHGDMTGDNPTGFIFCTYGVSGSGSACTIFNNLLVGTGGTSTGGQGIYFHAADGNPLGPHLVYNNTFDGFGTAGIYAESDTSTRYTIKNNIFISHGGWYMQRNGIPLGHFTSDHNLFFGARTVCGYACGLPAGVSLSAWQALGEDLNSLEVNPSLDASYIPLAGSQAIGLGANLTSVGITPLDSDKNLLTRPLTAAWTVGANNYSSLTLTLTPNPLVFSSQNTGTTSSPSTVTVTNNGAATVVLGSVNFYSITGANLSEFARSGGSCTLSQPLAPAATCTILVTFSPAAGGSRSARLNMLATASGSTDITGTGAAPGGGTNKVNAATELKNQVPVPNGGLNLSTIANHQTPVGTATDTYTAKTIPDCQDTLGQHINFTQSTNSYSCGTSGPSGVGSVTSVAVGDLSPLFTSSTSNPSTTPSTSFTLSTFAAHKFYGNNTGSTATPGAQTIGEADLPAATVFTDQNATFGAHTYDFSGVTIMKARVGAGLTSSANGDFGYDTTNKNWHFWTNAADKIGGVWSAPPTDGNCVKASVASSVVLLLDSGNPCPSGTNLNRRGIPFSIGIPGGTALTVASTTTDYVTVPIACTISGYNLLIDAGTITVKFWKKATGTAIPTSSDSISTSGVGISTGTAIHSATTSDFTTTTVTANDIMAMNVTAVATAAYVNGVIQCDQ